MFSPRLSLSEIKSERTDGVVRRELVSAECLRQPEQPALSARPCSEIDVCARRGRQPTGGPRLSQLTDIGNGSSESAIRPHASAPLERSGHPSAASWTCCFT